MSQARQDAEDLLAALSEQPLSVTEQLLLHLLRVTLDGQLAAIPARGLDDPGWANRLADASLSAAEAKFGSMSQIRRAEAMNQDSQRFQDGVAVGHLRAVHQVAELYRNTRSQAGEGWQRNNKLLHAIEEWITGNNQADLL